ncbi:MAG: type II toxin-antitoxin system VapC family toxin [Actinomycetota bacterium]
MSFVIDSSVLIDVLRGHEEAARFLVGLAEIPAASEMSRVEVMHGIRSGERSTMERLFRGLRWIAVDEAVARRAGELGRRWRRSHQGIGPVDLVVAASAQQLDLPVATTNVRHFPMFRGLLRPYPA